MTFQEALRHEFVRLYGREVTEPEWEIMEHPQRAGVIGAQAAATWNLYYRYTITALCKYTDLSRVEAMVFYAMYQSRQAHERTQAQLAKEPWK